jgi:hypothetical protein
VERTPFGGLLKDARFAGKGTRLIVCGGGCNCTSPVPGDESMVVDMANRRHRRIEESRDVKKSRKLGLSKRYRFKVKFRLSCQKMGKK